MRLWPRSLVGRTVLVMLAGILVSNVVAFAVFVGERREALSGVRGELLADRVSDAARLLEESPPEERRRLLRSLRGPGLRAFWSDRPLAEAGEADGRARRVLDALRDELADDDEDGERGHAAVPREVRVRRGPPPEPVGRGPGRRFGPPHHRSPHEALVGSVRLADGTWLNFSAPLAGPPAFWASGYFVFLLATTAAVIVISVWAVRQASRPLSGFARAADRLGLDVEAPPVAEEGPGEVRSAARAFNEMQRRLRSLIRDRTQMLAAISHDLRTPITRMRLRAELIDDAEEREKTLADLAEMESMIAATLAFARDDAAKEARKTLDLAALLQSVCDDAADAGGRAAYDGPERLAFAARPMALKRAFANLVENAVVYGGGARVTLTDRAGDVVVTVDDDGPGLPEGELERVFEPFRRAEGSRSRETGGVGLGLAVVRSVVRAHGGEVTLANRPEGGLAATVTLPKDAET